jgi:hypothetical protein
MINCFETRDDGTFTMVLQDPGGSGPPAGSGYYLRVRASDDSEQAPKRWDTPSFLISPAESEGDAVLVIPRGD